MTNDQMIIPNFGTLRASWSGLALQRSGTVTPFIVAALDVNGHTNVESHAQSAVRFWLTPYWSSQSLGGSGPMREVTLCQLVAVDSKELAVVWSLQVNPSGSALALMAAGDAGPVELLCADIAWAQTAHCIALNFGPEGTDLFVDGQSVAKGEGTVPVPPKVAGLVFGGAWDGKSSVEADLEEIHLFGRPQTEAAVAFHYGVYARQAALGPISPEEDAAWLERVTQWKATQELTLSLDQDGGGGMMSLFSGGCTGLTLQATLLTNSDLQIDICGREPGAVYDLIYATNLNPTITWHWSQEIATNVNTVVEGTTNDSYLFFQLKKLPDLDGDGLRDYWEWGGTPPGGVVIDDDRDNDGIPDSIEAASGSATNDPASLPPPSLYVNNNAAPGGDGSIDLPFRDIQTAINAATNFSVVLVQAGTYNGTSNRNLSFGGKKLVLLAERGWEATRIDCGDGSNRAFAFSSTNEDYHSQIIGFTITNAGAAAVSASGGSTPTFVNCQLIRNNAGAVAVTNASPVFVNCRFLTNSTTGNGAAIYATGSGSLVRLSHCTLNDNLRVNNGGQVYATGGATITLNSTIIWGVRTNLGAEIASSGGTVTADYCDVRGGYTGDGNLNTDPLFEGNGSARLTVISPCIDQGVATSVPGFSLSTRYDMDGEARLDHDGFANPYSVADIGADEFVYRIQFPTVAQTVWVLGTNGLYNPTTNIVSEVDEASGVAFLGTNATGPLISIVDDEDRTGFRIYQLNADASAVAQSVPVATLNTNYTGGDREIGDMEGLTYDGTNLLLITSQTPRNRFRDVDSSPPIVDAVVNPPSNDYDRRRAVLARLQLDTSRTNVTARTFYESEQVPVPYNTGYLVTNGLAAHLRRQLTNNPALRETNCGNKVLIAWNTVNKFGTPSNGVSYASNAALPYLYGGASATAGTSLGAFDFGSQGTNTHAGRTGGATYYYKIWAVDAQTNYYEGPTAVVTNNGIPRIYINEFDAAGDNETVELYNPSPVPVNIGGCYLDDDPNILDAFQIAAGTTIPARGVWTINNSVFGFNFSDAGSEDIYFTWTNQTTRLDQWNMKDPDAGGVDFTQGRVWDGGPRGFVVVTQDFASCEYQVLNPPSPYPTNLGSLNLIQPRKFLDAVADVDQTKVYLVWGNIGLVPGVWNYSPKQHDFHSINIEDVAFRSSTEMVLGLRAPLVSRTTGNAYYFIATNLSTFLPAGGWTGGQVQGIDGAYQMDLGGLGIRSIKWCPNGLTNASGQQVARYLVLAGNANGGPLVREKLRQKFSLYAWDGSSTVGIAHPQLLISDLAGYAIRPEGVELIPVDGGWRILFVEDRFQSTGYATRNAVHWPVSILGSVQ